MSKSFTERADLLKKALKPLRAKFGKQELEPAEDVVRQLLKIILIEETPEAVVEAALERINQTFVDLNEMRVSLAKEISDTLVGVARPHDKAVQITKLFNEIFLKRNSMDWSFVRTLGVRELRQYFEATSGGSPVLGAAAVMFFSNGHAVPADADVRRVLSRLDLTEPEESVVDLQGFLERAVTKEQGYETWALIHRLGESLCLVKTPLCEKCPLKDLCPTGRAQAKAAKGAKSAKKPAAKKPAAKKAPAAKGAKTSAKPKGKAKK
jgi:endonuclease-3